MADKPTTAAKEEAQYTASDVRSLIDQVRLMTTELDKMKQVLADGKERSSPAKEIKERTVSVMFIDKKPVIGIVNKGTDKRPLYLYDKKDLNRKNEYFLYADIIILGEEDSPITMDWSEFLENADREFCKIVDTKKIPWSISQGMTTKKVVDESYKIEIDVPTEVLVEGYTRIFTVLLPDGNKVDIDEKYVNIAK